MPKVGRIVTYGQGEEIWNDLEIMDQESAKRILELEQMNSSTNFSILELIDYNGDCTDEIEPKYKNIGAVSSVISTVDYIDTDFGDKNNSQEDEEVEEEDETEDISGDYAS